MHTDTALRNKVAQRFYIRNGYKDSGITRSYLIKRSISNWICGWITWILKRWSKYRRI